ncbi:MAG: isocitrate lyase/phosphoenolpyruvate mutase family protein [Chloroflexia bacterium]|nr:isocitrate lyase/phosphoenolpyruvate mutase family protein [Chloroflexia bacterium]
MTSALSIARANAFREMHQPGEPIVLVNVWDVASAKVVAAQPGTRALATASWSVSAAAGYEDGEGLPLDVALLAARRIVASTDLPVTVDFEKGYATSSDGVRENTSRLIETGAIGLNIEDSVGSEDGALWSLADAAGRVAAVRAAADRAGVPLVINARTDILVGGGSIAGAIERGNAYLASGADCVFVLGVSGESLPQVVNGIDGPVSVMAGATSPTIAEFAAAGVARVSFGPGSMGVAYAALARLAQEVHGGKPNSADLAYRPNQA